MDASAGQAGEPAKPVAIQLGKSNQEVVWQTAGEGEDFPDTCPVDQVLIGVEGTTESPPGPVRSIHGVCGEVTVVSSSTQGKFVVKVVQTVALPERGAPDSVTQVALCAPNQFVTGFSGRSGGFIDALQIRCASLAIAGATPNFELIVHAEGSSDTLGGPGGAGFEPTECPPDQVADGQIVRIRCTDPVLPREIVSRQTWRHDGDRREVD